VTRSFRSVYAILLGCAAGFLAGGVMVPAANAADRAATTRPTTRPSTRPAAEPEDPDPFLAPAKGELVLYEMLMVLPFEVHHTVRIDGDGRLRAVWKYSEHRRPPKIEVREGRLTQAQIDQLSATLARCERLPGSPIDLNDAVVVVRYRGQVWTSDHRGDAAVRQILKMAESFPPESPAK